MKKIGLSLIALAMIGSLVASPARAMQLPPEVYIQVSYYSDWTHAQLIGQYREYCDGHTASWGGISMWDYTEYNMC